MRVCNVPSDVIFFRFRSVEFPVVALLLLVRDVTSDQTILLVLHLAMCACVRACGVCA